LQKGMQILISWMTRYIYFKKIKCNNQSGDQRNCIQQLSSSEQSTSIRQYKISWKTAIDVASLSQNRWM
jgi:hypothetical protein